jgi:3-deoxy-D-manno-octulosonic-acid transferase
MAFLLRVYDATISIASPLLGLGFSLSKKGKERLAERFGKWNLDLEDKELLWFHGASAGETQGLEGVVTKLTEIYPSCNSLLTATNTTHSRLLPFDSSCLISRAIDKLNIKALIISETEIWPNLLRQASKRNIPIFWVNARISDMTYARYKLLAPLLREAFAGVKAIYTSNPESASRFQSLNLPVPEIAFVGNSKYDKTFTPNDTTQDLLKRFFKNVSAPTLCLGSIRPEEAHYWLPAISEIRKNGSKINIIIAPRHKEKFEYFSEELSKHNIPFVKWSDIKKLSPDYNNEGTIDTLLLDTYGDLTTAYSISTLAFIGATLTDIGGHNPLEASAQGVYVVVGPYFQNVKSEVTDLHKVKALEIVKNENDIKEILGNLLKNPKLFSERGHRGKEIWKQNTGATDKIVSLIKSNLTSL